jgi:uncharacterized protein (DUF362 family)/NAD-dependent dihydropyrimidine dehydrogenase PreA subunit
MGQKSQVALVRCENYSESEVEAAVRRGMDLLGGMQAFIQPGEKIVLKPNILVGGAPEKQIGPHPLVFQAVAGLAKEVTPNLTYGDSPGFGKTAAQARRAGLAQAAENMGMPLADFEHGRDVQFSGSPFLQRFVLANGVLDADGLVSICKFKAHQLTRVTGAVKNQFGCVPGAMKAEYHIKLPSALDFAKMLVTLNLYIRPRLFVMDGITAMQGNGPRNGTPINMNVLLFSTDPIALDAVMCRMIALEPEFVPTSRPGLEWGLGTYKEEDIEIVGDALPGFINPAFEVVRAPVHPVTSTGGVSFIKNQISPRPVIDASRCTRCGTCVKVCPATPKAVDWHDGDKARPPSYKYDRCIRCFCCQELCPEDAISVKTPLLGRLLGTC